MDIKNHIKKLPLVIISLVLFVFLCLLFIFLYKKINDNNQSAQAGMQTWQAETDRRDGIISLNQSLEQNADDRAALETHFVNSSDVVPFLDTIGQLGTSAGVAEEIDLVDTGTNNDKLVVELKASGSFAAVYKFLTLLENSSYELSVLSLDLEKLPGAGAPIKGSSGPTWEGDFQIQLLTFTP